MIVVCSWCGRYMREKEPIEDKRVSHGQCKPCQMKMREELDLMTSVDRNFYDVFIRQDVTPKG